MSEYVVPYVHPLVVHFPVALVPAAAMALVGWLIRDRIRWLVVAFWLHLSGLAGAVAALRTGQALERDAEGEPMVELFGPLHEEVAEWAVWTGALVLAVIAGSIVWHRRSVRLPGVPSWWRLAVTILGMAGAGLILWAAHIGGTMVWGVPR